MLAFFFFFFWSLVIIFGVVWGMKLYTFLKLLEHDQEESVLILVFLFFFILLFECHEDISLSGC